MKKITQMKKITMEPVTQIVEFSGSTSGTVLRGRFILPHGEAQNLPMVIMATGDGQKGTKSLSWTNLPSRLCANGIATFLFDFEGLGYSDGIRSGLTVSRGIDNFRAAFALAQSQGWLNPSRIGILASSYGATVVLLSPEITNRAKMLGLKSPASFIADAYANECEENELDSWLENGFSTKLEYDAEVLRDALFYNVYAEARKINTKILISHGDADQTVPIRQSKFLMTSLSGEKRLEIFQGVGHNYSEEGAWDRMADLFVGWFRDGL